MASSKTPDTMMTTMEGTSARPFDCVAEFEVFDILFSSGQTRTGVSAPHELLHDRRNGDSHYCQGANQFAANYGNGGQQKLFPLLIGLTEDGVAVIKRVEKLRELKRMLGEIRRFGS